MGAGDGKGRIGWLGGLRPLIWIIKVSAACATKVGAGRARRHAVPFDR